MGTKKNPSTILIGDKIHLKKMKGDGAYILAGSDVSTKSDLFSYDFSLIYVIICLCKSNTVSDDFFKNASFTEEIHMVERFTKEYKGPLEWRKEREKFNKIMDKKDPTDRRRVDEETFKKDFNSAGFGF